MFWFYRGMISSSQKEGTSQQQKLHNALCWRTKAASVGEGFGSASLQRQEQVGREDHSSGGKGARIAGLIIMSIAVVVSGEALLLMSMATPVGNPQVYTSDLFAEAPAILATSRACPESFDRQPTCEGGISKHGKQRRGKCRHRGIYKPEPDKFSTQPCFDVPLLLLLTQFLHAKATSLTFGATT